MKKLVMIWDYRMRWAPLKREPAYRCGGQPYEYGEAIFVEDHKRCIDFLAAHGYNGMAIWGLFRDSHGGEGAVRTICDYANRKGIGILATVGVGCYGGVYWEGKHRFNLDTFLEEHPETAALGPDGTPKIKARGTPWSMVCPSNPRVQEWTAAGIDWLARNFAIAGVELQCGDYGLCACAQCRARAAEDRAAKFSFRDVAHLVREPMRRLHGIRADLLITVNVYMAVRQAQNMAGDVLRRELPPYGHVTWWCHTSPVCIHPEPAWPTKDCDLTRYLPAEPVDAPLPFDLPGPRNIGQMVVNTTAYYGDKYIYLDAISKMARLAHRIGLDGIMLYGELCEFTHLVNYLALEAFLANPRLSLADFWRQAEPELRRATG
jgi:hypothetical protein